MDRAICNVCGKAFSYFDMYQNFHMRKHEIGYGSKHDGESFQLDMCCDCFDSIMDSIQFAVSPFGADPATFGGYEQLVLEGFD